MLTEKSERILQLRFNTFQVNYRNIILFCRLYWLPSDYMRDILIVVYLFYDQQAIKTCDITKNEFHKVRQPEGQMSIMLAT